MCSLKLIVMEIIEKRSAVKKNVLRYFRMIYRSSVYRVIPYLGLQT